MDTSSPVAVFCGSSLGNHPAFQHAAKSVGHALAELGHSLIYGGGQKGLMGVVSGAVLQKEGKVTGVVPYAMLAAGGEGSKTQAKEAEKDPNVPAGEGLFDKMEVVVVDSMHERKLEMARRAGGFIGLPGGYGTFEEVLEATTWNQLGIQSKPIVLLNVRGFYTPLRALIENGHAEGFIASRSLDLVLFVDGPGHSSPEEETFDWGRAAIEVLRSWEPPQGSLYNYNWTKTADSSGNAQRAGQVDV